MHLWSYSSSMLVKCLLRQMLTHSHEQCMSGVCARQSDCTLSIAHSVVWRSRRREISGSRHELIGEWQRIIQGVMPCHWWCTAPWPPILPSRRINLYCALIGFTIAYSSMMINTSHPALHGVHTMVWRWLKNGGGRRNDCVTKTTQQ